jgi:hypothetical protein
MKKLLVIVFVATLFPLPAIAASSTTFQITNTAYQETHPQIDKSLVAYTAFTGDGDNWIDIRGYDLKTHSNFPLIEGYGQQWVTDLDSGRIVYEDYNPSTQRYSVKIHMITTNKTVQVSPDDGGNYTSGVSNGRYVYYLKGGACGELFQYDRYTKYTQEIAGGACNPRTSREFLVWSAGHNIMGRNIATGANFLVTSGSGNLDSPDVYRNEATWLEINGNTYVIKWKNLVTGQIRDLYSTDQQYMNYPRIAGHFVVWGFSTSPGNTGVQALDLRNNEIFEIFPEGPHQNTNLAPEIYKGTAVWQAWRTGNGDIYGAALQH